MGVMKLILNCIVLLAIERSHCDGFIGGIGGASIGALVGGVAGSLEHLMVY